MTPAAQARRWGHSNPDHNEMCHCVECMPARAADSVHRANCGYCAVKASAEAVAKVNELASLRCGSCDVFQTDGGARQERVCNGSCMERVGLSDSAGELLDKPRRMP